MTIVETTFGETTFRWTLKTLKCSKFFQWRFLQPRVACKFRLPLNRPTLCHIVCGVGMTSPLGGDPSILSKIYGRCMWALDVCPSVCVRVLLILRMPSGLVWNWNLVSVWRVQWFIQVIEWKNNQPISSMSVWFILFVYKLCSTLLHSWYEQYHIYHIFNSHNEIVKNSNHYLHWEYDRT